MADTDREPIGEFLEFIGRDIDSGNFSTFAPGVLERSAALVAGVAVDLDEKLPLDDD